MSRLANLTRTPKRLTGAGSIRRPVLRCAQHRDVRLARPEALNRSESYRRVANRTPDSAAGPYTTFCHRPAKRVRSGLIGTCVLCRGESRRYFLLGCESCARAKRVSRQISKSARPPQWLHANDGQAKNLETPQYDTRHKRDSAHHRRCRRVRARHGSHAKHILSGSRSRMPR